VWRHLTASLKIGLPLRSVAEQPDWRPFAGGTQLAVLVALVHAIAIIMAGWMPGLTRLPVFRSEAHIRNLLEIWITHILLFSWHHARASQSGTARLLCREQPVWYAGVLERLFA